MDIFKPIKILAYFFINDFLKIPSHSYFGEALIFFIEDTLKIGFLLFLIGYLMAIIRYYLPIEKTKKILSVRRLFGLDYLLAAILGVITPFCSCSSIPLFIGFVSAGIPLGVTFSFLISSPLVNEASLYFFPAIFGLKITLIYNLIGVIIAILGGILIQKLKMEKYLNPAFLKFPSKKEMEEKLGRSLGFCQQLKFFLSEDLRIFKEVFLYVLFGVFLGALIHGFIPAEFIQKYLSKKSWYTVPLAVIFGAPLYANSLGVIPVMEALVKKGVPLGTTLAFMTSVVTISFPQALILKKVMKEKLLAIYFSIVILGIIIMGYIFNLIL